MYEKIEKLCNEKGISITNLCKQVTGSSGNLTTWKKGYMRSDYLKKAAEILEVTTDQLLDPDTCDVVSSVSNNNIQNGNNNNIAITNCDYDINEKKLIEKFRELDYEEQIKLMAEVIDRVKEKK